MKSKLILAAAALVSMAAPALAAPAATTTPFAQVQSPCREAGHTREQACVVVYKLVSGDTPMAEARFNLAPAKQLAGKVRNFSVIYAYKVRRGGLNSNIGMRIEHGNDTIISDLYTNRTTNFWLTTNDGGRSWSKLTTSDMSGSLAF